jgi:serine/threonine protein phosphatase PrpC
MVMISIQEDGVHELPNKGSSEISSSGYIAVVADGMGGVQGGELASSILREGILDLVGGSLCPNPEDEQLRNIVDEINFRILREADAEPNLEGMGTTLTLCWLKGNELMLTNVGDSRLYRLRSNTLEQLSKDQSPVGRLLREGRITVEESRTHPHRNVIDQAVGSHPEGIDPEFASFLMEDGDMYLLCSDGLNEELWDHEIAESLLDALRAEKPLIGAAEDLVAKTLLAGGKDNVTVILLKVGISS